MTTRTNEQVVGELGWTMQIIADVTGGHIPAFWRPPYGDVDNRVRAIAKEVFGLTTVLWNHGECCHWLLYGCCCCAAVCQAFLPRPPPVPPRRHIVC